MFPARELSPSTPATFPTGLFIQRSFVPLFHQQGESGQRRFAFLTCFSSAMTQPDVNISGDTLVLQQKNERLTARLGLPSKGRMAEGALNLLRDCQLAVVKPNPRQYTASIPSLPGLEVWFQRETDVVRKIRAGHVDLGIVGYDTVCEYGQGDEDLIIVHDSLQFGECSLALGVPSYGIFANVSSVAELVAMPEWSELRPLRIATGFTYLGRQFIEKSGLKHAQLLSADGALEAAPAVYAIVLLEGTHFNNTRIYGCQGYL
ncbi:hypothetical protein L7F22_006733 [Adiantum nelumboides]|nr:hypothetical protein [Adiantum nelumboides]